MHVKKKTSRASNVRGSYSLCNLHVYTIRYLASDLGLGGPAAAMRFARLLEDLFCPSGGDNGRGNGHGDNGHGHSREDHASSGRDGAASAGANNHTHSGRSDGDASPRHSSTPSPSALLHETGAKGWVSAQPAARPHHFDPVSDLALRRRLPRDEPAARGWAAAAAHVGSSDKGAGSDRGFGRGGSASSESGAGGGGFGGGNDGQGRSPLRSREAARDAVVASLNASAVDARKGLVGDGADGRQHQSAALAAAAASVAARKLSMDNASGHAHGDGTRHGKPDAPPGATPTAPPREPLAHPVLSRALFRRGER